MSVPHIVFISLIIVFMLPISKKEAHIAFWSFVCSYVCPFVRHTELVSKISQNIFEVEP